MQFGFLEDTDICKCCTGQVAETLVQPVDAYFEQVFVMCDDEAMRQSRLALLRDIADLPSGIVNFSLLPGF